MKKQRTIGQLKKIAWKLFSELIRRNAADFRGFVRCYICGVVKHWKEMDAAHYESRRFNSTLFDRQNVHACCKKCNIWLYGNMPKYALKLKQDYGEGILETLNKRASILKQFTKQELENLIIEFKNELSKL